MELVKQPLVQYVLSRGEGRVVGDGTFEYRITRAEDGSHTGQVVMLFFGAVLALSAFLRTPDIERIREGELLTDDDPE